jgi:hypothetical protein
MLGEVPDLTKEVGMEKVTCFWAEAPDDPGVVSERRGRNCVCEACNECTCDRWHCPVAGKAVDIGECRRLRQPSTCRECSMGLS